MKKDNIFSLLPPLLKVSREVSKTIMEFYLTDFEIINKDDNSPVTGADIAANNLLVSFLKKMTPNIYISSEELIDADPLERSRREWIWCIDPLDGTKEFIKKNGEFSVNIALIHKRIPVLGIVILPALNSIYYAVKNKGAYYVDSLGKTTKIELNPMKPSSEVIALTSKSHHNKQTESILIEKFGKINWIPKGSSLKFIALAKCEADIYLKIGTTMEWDIAAPQVILEECGGRILSYSGKSPLDYNKTNLMNPDFVAMRKGFDFWENP